MTKWRFVAQRVIFLAFLTGLFFALNAYAYDRQNVSVTWETVQRRNSTSDILFMGSSYVYTSIDANYLSQALNIDVNILGSPKQNMSIVNENLRVLLKTHRPKIIVLEIGSALMSNEEELNSDKKSLVYNNIDGMNSLFDRFCASYDLMNTDDLFEGTFQLLRSTKMWDRFSRTYREKNEVIFEEVKYARGSELRGSMASTDSSGLIKQKTTDFKAWYAQHNRQQSNKNEEQLKQFLQITQEHGIEVWFYRAPTTTSDEEYMAGVARIHAIGEEYGIANFDFFLLDMEKIGITTDDFYDPGHLNRNGAAKISDYYGPLIGERLQIAYDPTRAFAYTGESVQQQADGAYLYAMTNAQPGTQYRFTLKHKKVVLKTSGFSQDNTFTCTVDVRTKTDYDLQVEMIPPQVDPADSESVAKNEITLSFMKRNGAVL